MKVQPCDGQHDLCLTCEEIVRVRLDVTLEHLVGAREALRDLAGAAESLCPWNRDDSQGRWTGLRNSITRARILLHDRA